MAWRVQILASLLLWLGAAVCSTADPPPIAGPSRLPAPFPNSPPIADADPSVRHAVTVRAPMKLAIERTADALTISLAEPKPIDLTVGKNMETGWMCEEKIYQSGDTPREGSTSIHSGLDLTRPYMEFYTTSKTHKFPVPSAGQAGYATPASGNTIPQPGIHYVVAWKLTIFETELPAQHDWVPQSGKFYRVLWTKILQKTVE